MWRVEVMLFPEDSLFVYFFVLDPQEAWDMFGHRGHS